ncbi:Hpt domain-containing protein [Pedobacter sp. SD-b]|uniref:Hpt domain-containing protein n=1 Tax=Pedobacter segetis TaxID=2793069 RepID=A0ABS1BHR2_9SPHI|nr:Hpt domain-containing protein [Pedobacter segetis]MBK0382405.1 Hpt domain-containing protein [Pedobacter segetis]
MELNDKKELVLDLSYLQELADDNTDFIVEMIDIFLMQTPDYVAALEAGVVAKDFKAIGDAAHKIKPTLSFMGLALAKETMVSIEARARNQDDYMGILQDFESLKLVFDKVYIKLKEKKEELLAKG